tara:strand:- start:82 stop:834 length:753 start_codon:yes stop_codon:yes gene_type:complete
MVKEIHVISHLNNLAIDIPDGNSKNGQLLQVWKENGDKNQTWVFEDGFILSAKNRKFSLDVKDGNFEKGTAIQLWEKHGGESQQWIVDDGLIKCANHPHLCLDIDTSNKGENGSKLQLWEVIGGENQRWILELTQKEIDSKKKEAEREAQRLAKEQEKAAKLATKEAEKAAKLKEKEAAQQKKLKEHRFKTSKGKTYCQYCGRDNYFFSDSDCYGRANGHNYVMVKKNDHWEPICNKCGKDYDFAEFSCG